MAWKKLDDVKTGWDSWEGDLKDMAINISKENEKQLRFVDLMIELQYHSAPCITKAGRLSFFPLQCRRWDHKEGEFVDESCPGCDSDLLRVAKYAAFVLDYDKLMGRDADKALRVIVLSQSDINKIKAQSAFNKVDRVPISVGDPKHGRVISMAYDKSASDPKMRVTFGLGDRLVVKVDAENNQIKVKVPEDSESSSRGKVIVFDLPDLAEIIKPLDLATFQRKMEMMKVEEGKVRADAKYNKGKKDDKKDDEEDEPKSKKKSKAPVDDDDDESPKKKKAKPADDDDDLDDEPPKKKSKKPVDEDDEDEAPKAKKKSKVEEEDDFEEEPPKKKSKKSDPDDDEDEAPKKKSKKPVDDEDDFEEEPPKRSKSKKEPEPSDDDDDEPPKAKKKAKPADDDDDEPPKKKSKKPVDDADDFDDEDEAPKAKKKSKKSDDEDDDF